MPETPVQPDEYVDEEGYRHILCACGHYVSSKALAPGTLIAICPNCKFMLSQGIAVDVPRVDRLPNDVIIIGTTALKG